VSVRKAATDRYQSSDVCRRMYASNSQSPMGGLTSVGPEVYDSILVDAMKTESFSGAPGTDTSLASLRVTPAASPSPVVEAITPS
jgi:hypothetical protein